MAGTQKLEATPAPIDASDLLTAEQLSARLQVKPSWVFEQTRKRGKLHNKNPLPCIYLSPKVLRFSWTAVSAWIRNKD